jgi:hypothetical protein
VPQDSEFSARVRTHYPEGLTGIIAVGGTRTSYILSTNPGDPQVGQIADPAAYAAFGRERYFDLVRMFFELGGQNLIIPVLSYQSFYERGQEYANTFIPFARWLIGEEFQQIYRDLEIDPYFCGVDTLLHLPKDHAARALGNAFNEFRGRWGYEEGRRKVIWEIAPMPVYSFWAATTALSDNERAAFNIELAALTDLEQVYQKLFHFYARATLGTDISVPHFYLGTNRNGDLKLRAPMSLSLVCGGPFRAFYTPYPTLFLTRDALQTMIDDLMSGGGLRSFDKDYRGQYTEALFLAEQSRVFALRDDPRSTLGLLRRTSDEDED